LFGILLYHLETWRITLVADPSDMYRQSGKERKLGIMVARGTSVMTISPAEGMHELIENPFFEHAEG
jgi:U6 snRNA-associated Sm-like protein LSm7